MHFLCFSLVTVTHRLQEVDDFFRKRGEAEAEYSRQLEKLAKGIMQRHKAEKNRFVNRVVVFQYFVKFGILLFSGKVGRTKKKFACSSIDTCEIPK
ncbi:unnamed protein product [Nippostrongylus brasiliensis]|uniref:FCH domain-containing protein n=1 Tax=Nippostrongylus brasiliensis TaxID=27835 RepID=A0A0N4YSI4_NIPBR|nr:unnamed protein product [Nippostrongylus brasiliensis]